MTKGRLPTSVYWRRRLVLLTVVGVVAIVGLKAISHLGGGSADPNAANLTSNTGTTETTDPTDSGSSDPTTSVSNSPSESDSTLPVPTGDCDPTDIVVSPAVGTVGSDGAIGVTLNLHTMDSPACNWKVSDHTMQVKITTRGKTVWSTADCPKDMPDQSVIVYRDSTTSVPMTWSGRFSSPGCPTHERWASYGNYQATAAVFGGEPGDDKFSLVAPSQVTPSQSDSPSDGPSSSSSASESPSGKTSDKASDKASDGASESPSGQPSDKPSRKR